MHLVTSQRELRGWRNAFFAACGLLALTLSAKVANGDQYCGVGVLCQTPEGCAIASQITYYCCSQGDSFFPPVGDVCCQYSCTTYYYGGSASCSGMKCVQSVYAATHYNSLCGGAGFCQNEGSHTNTRSTALPAKQFALPGDGSVVLFGAATIASAR